jgi:ABC-type multidrug transport system fused ATPase/permease subunit
VVFPQAFKVSLPAVTNDFIALFKDSSIVSVIAMVELTKTYGILAATTFVTSNWVWSWPFCASASCTLCLFWRGSWKKTERAEIISATENREKLERDDNSNNNYHEWHKRRRITAIKTSELFVSKKMIKVRNLHKSFGDQRLFKGISLDVSKGEVVVLIGPSGSGKSTFLRCINGLETFEKGEIDVDGITLQSISEGPSKRDAETIRQVRLKVGMVFQQFNLFPHMTVLENIIEAPVYVLGREKKKAEEGRRRSSGGSISTGKLIADRRHSLVERCRARRSCGPLQ